MFAIPAEAERRGKTYHFAQLVSFMRIACLVHCLFFFSVQESLVVEVNKRWSGIYR